jgi:dynein heavy chain, axonemal
LAASLAAEGVCSWILAMSKYDKVSKIIAPKQAELKVAEGDYMRVTAQLEGKRVVLLEVEGSTMLYVHIC